MFHVINAKKNESIALVNFADAIDYGEKYYAKFVVVDEDEYIMYDSVMDELVNELTEYTEQ
jgi:hypothetical protein